MSDAKARKAVPTGFLSLVCVFIWLLLISLLLAVFPIALSAQKQSVPYKQDSKTYAELTKAPKKAVARRNPLQNDPDAVAAGANLFDQHCAECHGEMAEGTRKGPSLLVDEVQQATPGAIFWILTNGVVRRGMPVWSKLPEPQRWQLVTYIKSLTPSDKASQGR